MRGKNIAIGVLAAAGFFAIVRLSGGPAGDGAPAPATPPPSLPLAEAPTGQEATPEPGEISVLSLLGEMIDLERLAHLPAPPFTAGQAASTDRRSTRPQDGESWFANDDFVTETQPNLVRVERRPDGGKRYVLLDTDGPGAIVRIWTATTGGTLRIHIDGDEKPALETPVADLLRGAVSPFVAPLAHVAARGNNLYFPFPFARHCLVTVDDIVSPDPFTGKPIAKLYYQIGYRRYRAGEAARVRAYSAAELARAAPTIGRVAKVLRDGPPPFPARADGPRAIAPAAVQPRQPSVTTIDAPPGGGEIRELRITTAERSPQRLRSTRLTIEFDGQQTVNTPLIDFFGTGPAWNTYATLPFTVASENLLICRFRMPFAKRAVVTIARNDPGTIDVAGTIDVVGARFGNDSLLFHAGSKAREIIRTRPFRDWTIATIGGEGQLVGTLLNVENPPDASWWGEGDEKITIDGETFPSLFGTGTEDYFGYAWSTPERFEHAYHAQTATANNGFGGLYSMNRFHILDPIPFSRELRFDFEIWHWQDTSIAVDATVYWYARPGSRPRPPHSSTGSASRPAAR